MKSYYLIVSNRMFEHDYLCELVVVVSHLLQLLRRLYDLWTSCGDEIGRSDSCVCVCVCLCVLV